MEPSHLRRHTERGAYDVDSIQSVFEDCFLAHVSYIDQDLPVCLPMIALVREESDEEAGGLSFDEGETVTDDLVDRGDTGSRKHVVYLHGHPSARLMELVRKTERDVGATEATNGTRADKGRQDGVEASDTAVNRPVKVCIVATKVDGLVLSSAPNGHTFNYRSAVIHGTCAPVHNKAVKRKIMHDVTNHIVAGRWEEVNPVASFQVSLVYVIRVAIDRMSVKTRTGPPGIQPRNAQADGPDMEPKPWTGVIPLWEQLGEPVESGLTPGAVVSDSLKSFVNTRNEKHRAHSENGVQG